MKAVFMSIQPKWCELIASGKKTVEVRKTRPKLETPFKCYIYCTVDKRLLRKFNKGERIDDECFFDEHVFVRQNTWIRGHFNPNKKVIGEFVCDNIAETGWYLSPDHPMWKDRYDEETCLTDKETYEYSKGGTFYHWHISDLVIYDKPKKLSEFSKECKCECDMRLLPDPPCEKCEHSKITRPPQSWCYVEV